MAVVRSSGLIDLLMVHSDEDYDSRMGTPDSTIHDWSEYPGGSWPRTRSLLRCSSYSSYCGFGLVGETVAQDARPTDVTNTLGRTEALLMGWQARVPPSLESRLCLETV